MLVPKVLAHGSFRNEEMLLGYLVMPKLDVTLEIFLEESSGLEKTQKVIGVII